MPIMKSSVSRLSPTQPQAGPVKLLEERLLGKSMPAENNPFVEADTIDQTNPFAEDLNPFHDREGEEGAEAIQLLNTSPPPGEPTTPKKNGVDKHPTFGASLKRAFRMSKKPGRSPTEDQGEEKKSFLKFPSPLSDPETPWKGPEKKGVRRRSEELGSPVKLGDGIEKESPVEPSPRKVMSFLKRNKAKAESPTERAELGGGVDRKTETLPEVREPLSVLEIHKLIERRELVLANSHIVELEAEEEVERVKNAEGGKDGSRKAKDVELLYEALEGELKKIVAESLSQAPETTHLEQLVQTIEEEEKADRAWTTRGGLPGGPRPRELRQKWREMVRDSVAARLSSCQGDAPICQRLKHLKEQITNDLRTVRKSLVLAYPKEYDAFNVYVNSYHEVVSSCLAEMVQNDLEIHQLYSFLQWCHNDYFRDVVGHEELAAHIRKQQLKPLLPPETVQQLEDRCIALVKTQITKNMDEELSVEKEKWQQGTDTYQSELSTKVIQLLTDHVENSAAVTQELGARVALCCLSGLADLLQSFQKHAQQLFQQYPEKADGGELRGAQAIAVVNCCPAFRDYIERLRQKVSSDSEEETKMALAALDRVVKGGNEMLTQKLLEELKPNFSKLLKTKWLQNKEIFESITTIIKKHFNQFRKMKNLPYQDLVNDIHRKVVTEYVRAVMQTRMVCSSADMRMKVAGQLNKEAVELREMFANLNSSASWLDAAIEHLAEIISLKDTSSVQMEVGALANSYPDVRKEHIEALLNIRGDISHQNRQNIVETLRDFDGNDGGSTLSRGRALFAEIDATPLVQCAHLNMSCALRCFSVFRRRSVCVR
ncbi:exocyst complex component 3-like isoform X2 [Hemiscyllium ocellatum]|nr:exocyst complex component 3-like isoform X2 [Hemiscyllium ocellatum]XP_060712190.1 exocyst complex component 3-like isoform X2 [Hemiscyllium ocellatum]XP_060712191.1 exocyst complex component 3-like isoform X2 [Hemiscyllium ocellatum]